jgi:hypothetical protein
MDCSSCNSDPLLVARKVLWGSHLCALGAVLLAGDEMQSTLRRSVVRRNEDGSGGHSG